MEKELATQSSILAWRIPINRGAWRATIHGVSKVGHGLVIKPPYVVYLHWCVSHSIMSMGFSRQEYWSGLPFPSPILAFRFSNIYYLTLYLKLFFSYWYEAYKKICIHNTFISLYIHIFKTEGKIQIIWFELKSVRLWEAFICTLCVSVFKIFSQWICTAFTVGEKLSIFLLGKV